MPLPVVLISTISKDGVHNAAPWSCVTPVLRPLDEVLIASWLKRDTLENIRQTGEFVINVPPAGMEEAVMICAKNFPPEVDELEKAGLQPRLSRKVRAPGIEGCLAWRSASSRRRLPGISSCSSSARWCTWRQTTGSSPKREGWTTREQSRSAPWVDRMECSLSGLSRQARAINMHPC